jgi:hypothetical protein
MVQVTKLIGVRTAQVQNHPFDSPRDRTWRLRCCWQLLIEVQGLRIALVHEVVDGCSRGARSSLHAQNSSPCPAQHSRHRLEGRQQQRWLASPRFRSRANRCPGRRGRIQVRPRKLPEKVLQQTTRGGAAINACRTRDRMVVESRARLTLLCGLMTRARRMRLGAVEKLPSFRWAMPRLNQSCASLWSSFTPTSSSGSASAARPSTKRCPPRLLYASYMPGSARIAARTTSERRVTPSVSFSRAPAWQAECSTWAASGVVGGARLRWTCAGASGGDVHHAGRAPLPSGRCAPYESNRGCLAPVRASECAYALDVAPNARDGGSQARRP